jgi:hypothetical protein
VFPVQPGLFGGRRLIQLDRSDRYDLMLVGGRWSIMDQLGTIPTHGLMTDTYGFANGTVGHLLIGVELDDGRSISQGA